MKAKNNPNKKIFNCSVRCFGRQFYLQLDIS